MNFQEYAAKARTTAVYPSEHGLAYAGLGLIEEIFETVEEFSPHTVKGAQDSVKELGDIMWYSAALLHECGGLFVLQEPSYIPGDYDEILDIILRKAGYIAGRIKKTLRGDKDFRNEIIYTVNEIINYVEVLARWVVPVNTEDALRYVMEKNIEKLFDRQTRGVLKGDGSNR